MAVDSRLVDQEIGIGDGDDGTVVIVVRHKAATILRTVEIALGPLLFPDRNIPELAAPRNGGTLCQRSENIRRRGFDLFYTAGKHE